NESARSTNTVDTFDINAHHTFGLGERHDIIWGLGYRFAETKITKTAPNAMILNGEQRQHLFSVFAQDEFKLVPEKLILTAGIKIEHNDFNGVEFQPSI